MNAITKLFEDLTDNQLIEAVSQIQEDEPKGIIRSGGYVRELTRKFSEITGENNTIHLTMVQMSIFREAAIRFSNRKVYVVLSRDRGLVCATRDSNKVNELIKEQEVFEEMAGGRPSVYHVERELI